MIIYTFHDACRSSLFDGHYDQASAGRRRPCRPGFHILYTRPETINFYLRYLLNKHESPG